MSQKQDVKAEAPGEAKFSKTQILSSKQFKPLEKDVLGALLQDGKKYTITEAKERLDKYLKQEAK